MARLAMAASFVATMSAVSPPAVKAVNGYAFRSYAGEQTCTADWSSCSYWYGIDGYIRLSAYNPYPQTWSTEEEALFFNISPSPTSGEWVQIGEYQGVWGDRSKLTGIGYFAENTDPCLNYTPVPISVGGDQNADTAFYLQYATTIGEDCGNAYHTYRLWNYYYNWSNYNGNRPVYQGVMSTATGFASAGIELHNLYGNDGQTYYAANGTNYFGCDLNRACGNNGYALRLKGSSGWTLWSASTPSSYAFQDRPPYVYVVNNYYNFYTRGN